MSTHRIGELLPQIMARAATMAKFQNELNALPDDGQRKTAILEARMADELGDEDCYLLLQAYGISE
jgi:hypothetical protein